jgi:hypothetical protein
MNLQNGCYYKTEGFGIVKCQLQADDHYHIYNASGSEVAKLPRLTEVQQGGVDGKGKETETTLEVPTHVEGWQPVGVAEFQKAGKAAKKEAKRPKPKDKKKDA